MEQIAQFAISLVRGAGIFGYWFAFLAAFAETLLVVGLLLPGSALILLMGVLAGQGYLDLGDLLGFAIAGAVLGDNVNYWLGRRYGRRWLRQQRWLLKAENLRKAEDFFRRHGGKSVFFARFVPSLKEVVPFIAGMAHMRSASFMLWNLVGAVGWALQWVLPGYVFSQSLVLAHVWLSRIGILILIFIVLVTLLYGIRWLVLRYGTGGFRFVVSILHSITTAIRLNPDVAEWANRHPRLTAFLKRRLDSSQLRGIPLTVVAIAMGYLLLLFGGLVEDLLTREAIVTLDVRVNSLLATLRTPVLNRAFYFVTTLANWQFVVAGLCGASLILWWLNRSRLVLPMLIASASAQGLAYLGKFAFQRPRPAFALLEQAGHAFPSGHASISIAFYGFLCFAALQRCGTWQARVNWVFAAVTLALIIGFSRLYLGVHYLSDVLAGYVVGGLGLLLGIAFVYAGWPGLALPSGFPRLKPVVLKLLAGMNISLWMGILVYANLHPPRDLTATPKSPPTKVVVGPSSAISLSGDVYLISATGYRRAPVNLVFVAADFQQLQACLKSAGWRTASPVGLGAVIGAYFDVIQHRANPSAPLSPWFWRDRPQDTGWVLPDTPSSVFARRTLRIWSTPYKTGNSSAVFVATTGHERLPPRHLIPVQDPLFDSAGTYLSSQLLSRGLASKSDRIAFPSNLAKPRPGLVYEGNISVITLAGCR